MPEAGAKKVVLGVSGSIAAYKAVLLCREMQREGWDVWVAMTACATQYVGPLTFRGLTGHPVPHGRFEDMDPDRYEHLALAEGAAAVVVAPCTAATMARLAHGAADDIVSCTALSAPDAALVVAPAMNTRMWRHPATQANAEILRSRGARIVGPDTGELGCGDTGPGRLAETAAILAAVREALGAAGKRDGI